MKIFIVYFRDWIIFMAGWLGMLGIQTLEDTAAKWLCMALAVTVYAACLFWRPEY